MMPILLVALRRNENIPLTFDEIVNRGMCRIRIYNCNGRSVFCGNVMNLSYSKKICSVGSYHVAGSHCMCA